MFACVMDRLDEAIKLLAEIDHALCRRAGTL